ncbi:MAG: rane protein [Gammaproteobacteria bacterium]|jgi:hypothetical protein|nr:rane protein [Gammaproteobacteria bacterium]
MKKNALFLALLIYGIFSLVTLFSWHTKGINTVTGDEPHYLVMSSGIVKQGLLEQTAPYREEFKAREIYKHGLASEDAQPSPENTHAVLGPNGLFNVHNIGLPLLLAVPFLLGGVVGAKLFMVFFGALVVIAAWKFSSHFSENRAHRLWAVIGATISLPLIPASNQIYPDVLAGLIALTGLYWFFTVDERRTAGLEVLLATAIVFLPWLQIKFAATCVILVLSITAKIYFQSKDLKRITRIFIIAGASCVALASYNYYAFGKISGPYQSGALEISKTSLMVLLGLHIDQNQGFILQNPVNLIGILAIGWMYKLNRTFALVWALVFLSLIVPNALHPNWYGGGSFSGRFQWAAAIAFMIPTIYGLLVIANSKEKMLKAIIASGALLQLYFFHQYARSGVNLYNKGAGTWFDAYSIFYYPLQAWMPMLYDSSWAYRYWPNYSWTILVGTLLLLGFLSKERISRKYSAILAANLLIIFVAGFSNNHQTDETVFKVDQLPSQTGRMVNANRFAEQNVDKPGFTSYGPYFPLKKGSYEVVISYKSSAGKSEVIGWADVFNATSGKQLIQIPIQGTDNVKRELAIEFESTQWKLNLFEFRTYWNRVSNIEVHDIVLRNN